MPDLTERRASAPITLGQQPEALAVLETAARRRGMKPRDQGLEAKPGTGPVRENSGNYILDSLAVLGYGFPRK